MVPKQTWQRTSAVCWRTLLAVPVALVLLLTTQIPASASVTWGGAYGRLTVSTLNSYQARTTRVSSYTMIRSDIQYHAPIAGAPMTAAYGDWSP